MKNMHPVFSEYCRNNSRTFREDECGGGDLNFLGLHIPMSVDALRNEEEYWSGRSAKHWSEDSSMPNPHHEDYFEYVDLLESISRCEGRYQMAEIGAGYGRWMLNAAHAIRRCCSTNISSYFLLGFEADVSRSGMLRSLMAKNDISNYDVVQKIVTAPSPDRGLGETLPFVVHNTDASRFGGAIIDDSRDIRSGRRQISNEPWMRVENLPTCRLSDEAARYGIFDFVNFDIQNAEIEVIPDAIDYLSGYVKLAHVGTHSVLAGEIVSEIFLRANWLARWQFPWKAEAATPFGTVQFRDGIQSFENPKFMRGK